MRRRTFIGLIGSAPMWLPAARAQQQSVLPVIGFLSGVSREATELRLRAFRKGLEEKGFVEGRNFSIEYRWTGGQHDRSSIMAADLVRRQVVVIFAGDGGAALAAKSATNTIPIVFRLGIDPVEAGLVSSLNRPGFNVTGVASLSTSLGAKMLELVHAANPKASVTALLVRPSNPNAARLSKDIAVAARSLALTNHIVQASSAEDFEAAFSKISELGASGLVIAPDPLYSGQSTKLAALAIRHNLTAVNYFREFAEAGGLMSYGNSFEDSYRLAGVFVGRILMGESPTELPVQQSTKVELIINLKTAKTLGLTLPLTLLGRADEVIE